MASKTQWTWVWANSGRYWRIRETWCALFHGVKKSCTQLSNWKTTKQLSTLVSSGCSCKPPTRQSLIYVLLLFISIWMKRVVSLKVKHGRQRLEKGLLCIFQATANSLLQKSTDRKFRAEGTDPVWSQICSSLLSINFLFLIGHRRQNAWEMDKKWNCFRSKAVFINDQLINPMESQLPH